MRIGLIDVDGHNFPNLPLMKLSAWHKQQGDTVEWYEPLFYSMGEPFDKVYMSKVFSFTPDYPYYVNAKEVHKGGSGYCIKLVDGKEVYDTEKDGYGGDRRDTEKAGCAGAGRFGGVRQNNTDRFHR